MGTSKTGWMCHKEVPFEGILVCEVDDAPSRCEHTRNCRRVTVRVDETPKQMTREELGEKIRPGWRVAIADGRTPLSAMSGWVFISLPEGEKTRGSKQQVCFVGFAHEITWNRVTHARPHDEAPWIEIVD